jgi:hypothetical protein
MTRRMADPAFRNDQWNRRREPQVNAINALCDQLMEELPGFSVPYIAPHYGASTARILALSSNPGPQAGGVNGSGMLSRENNDGSAARMGVIYESVGLSDSQIVPWNAYPWHVHETHPNGLPNSLIHNGLYALKRLLELHPNIQAVVAHGGDAHRSVKLFMSPKYFGAYADGRGLKVWNARHTSNRAFILQEPERSIALEGVCAVYRDAMRHSGLEPLNASAIDLPAALSGPELRTVARAELLAQLPEAGDLPDRIAAHVRSLTSAQRMRLLVELLSRDLAS